MAIEQDAQISIKVPKGLVKKAKALVDPEKSTLKDDPRFEYARISVSLAYRLALEIGLEQLTGKYIGAPPKRRKADQITTQPPLKPAPNRPAKPTTPTLSSTAQDRITGEQLARWVDRLTEEYGIQQQTLVAEIPKMSQSNFSPLKTKPWLTPKMSAKVRRAILTLVPDFDFG